MAPPEPRRATQAGDREVASVRAWRRAAAFPGCFRLPGWFRAGLVCHGGRSDTRIGSCSALSESVDDAGAEVSRRPACRPGSPRLDAYGRSCAMRPVTRTMAGRIARRLRAVRAANNFVLATDLCGPRAWTPAQRSGLEWTSAPSAGPMPSRRAGRGVGVRARRRRSAAPTGRARGTAALVGAIDRKKPSLPARAAVVRDRARGGVPRRGGPARRGRASRRARRGRPRAPRRSPSPRVDEPRPPPADAREPSSTKPKMGWKHRGRLRPSVVGASPPPGRWWRVCATPRFCRTSPAPHCARWPRVAPRGEERGGARGRPRRLLAAHEKAA